MGRRPGSGGHGPTSGGGCAARVLARRRDRFQGAGGCAGRPARLVCVARGSAAGHDRGVLPVTPFSLWCLVPGNKSGAGGDHAGWVLSLSSTPIRFGFLLRRPPGSLVLQFTIKGGEAAMTARGRARRRTVPRLSPSEPGRR